MARVRSPNYPALGLPAAVDMVRKVHSLQQNTTEPRNVVLKHMGYSGVNGRALKSISALIKYGFLKKEGKEGLRVSDRAVAILYPDPDNPNLKEQELFAASREPDLFADIFDRWSHRPSEDSLRAFLIQKGYNLNSVEAVARAFYETYDLVSDFDALYDSDAELENEEDDDALVSEKKSQQKHAKSDDAKTVATDTRGASMKALPINLTKPIFDFETVEIATKIDNQEDLSKLISRLEQIKSMLPKKSEDESDISDLM